MFSKILTGFIVSSMFVGSVVLAGPPAARAVSIEGFIKETAKESKKSEDDVRREVVESLRRSNKVTEAELNRIERGESATESKDASREKGMIGVLRRDSKFQVNVGLAAKTTEGMRLNAAGDSFDTIMKGRLQAVEGKSDVQKINKAERSEAVMTDIQEAFGKNAELEQALRIKDGHEANRLKIARTLAKRIRKMTNDKVSSSEIKEFREYMTQLMVDEATSPKVLGGDSVLGDNASEACLNMEKQAVVNLAKFVRGGAIEGRDKVTYLDGMARVAAKEFKQKLEEGRERVCALQGSSCGLLGNAIGEACKLSHAAAL